MSFHRCVNEILFTLNPNMRIKKTLKIDTIDLALIVRVVNKNSKSSYTYIQRGVIDLIVTPINQKLKSNVFAVKFI